MADDVTLKETLYNMYWEEGLSTWGIAERLGVAQVTVWRKMHKLGIPFRSRLKIRKEVLEELYVREGLGANTIAKKLGVTPAAVHQALKRYGIERRGASDYVYIHPNLAPSPSLSYVLGALLGDGCVTEKGYEITLKVRAKEFAESFHQALQAIGLNPIFYSSTIHGKTYYVAKACSKEFVYWYKGLTIDDIKNLVWDFANTFLRGLYEAEGHFDKKRYRIDITNTNIELLKLAESLLKKFSFHPRIYKVKSKTGKKPLYRLYLLRNREVDKFFTIVKPVIKR